MSKLKILLIFSLLFSAVVGWSQGSSLQGFVKDAATQKGIEGALVRLEKTKISDETGEDGSFNLQGVPKKGTFNLIVTMDGFESNEQSIVLTSKSAKAVTILLKKIETDSHSGSTEIPTVTLEQADSETSGGQDVASALGASRDIFQTAVSFNLGVFRYAPRGYDGENTLLYLNNIPLNDPETGFAGFNEFGGLNDVTRSKETAFGLEPTEFTFGGIGGAALIDTRASRQRKQIRVGYAISNRTYTNRVMATYSTGLMPNGWAVSVSASHRWAQEGYVVGTNYEGTSYFLSIDKKIKEKHLIDFTFLGAQFARGRSVGSYQEMNDIAGSNYYNPYWGYQNGEKRNAYIAHQNQPIAILRYDYDISLKSKWTTSVSYQTGPRGSTALDWYNAPDPRPDYYKKMPFYWGYDPTRAAEIRENLAASESNRQIDFNGMFYANQGLVSIANANGQAGNTVTGKQSLYIIEDRRSDSNEANFNTVFNHVFNSRVTNQTGVTYQYYQGKNFKTVNDLLGGDFYADWDKYAEQTDPGSETTKQNDLLHPNKLAKKGDRFGYDYDENIRNASAWTQVQVVLPKVDFFAAGSLTQTQFWRTGNVQNGKFPENSLGKGEKHTFNNFAVKGGLTYKITGAHFIYANGGYLTRAPQFRNAYLQPRSRDGVAPNVGNEIVTSFEGGYLLRTPYFKGRLSAFYTTIENQSLIRTQFIDDLRVFGNIALTGLDEKHTGLEAAIEAKLTTAMTLTVAGSAGEFIYTSRPNLYVVADNDGTLITDGVTTYLKNFYVRGPQDVATATIRYDLPKHAFINVSANWCDKIWLDFDPTRRTTATVSAFDDKPVIRKAITDQSFVKGNWTLDFFGGKSWKINRNFLYLNVGVSNLLNKKFIINGYEPVPVSTKLEPEDVTSVNQLASYGLTQKVTYGFGTTYFVQLSWKL